MICIICGSYNYNQYDQFMNSNESVVTYCYKCEDCGYTDNYEDEIR